MSEKLPSRCPNCGGTNLQTEPLYDEEEGPTEELALFCVSCGRYMGEMPSQLKGSMRDFRGSLSHFGAYRTEAADEAEATAASVREFLLGRRAATPDFD
jgi:hypothetical protein